MSVIDRIPTGEPSVEKPWENEEVQETLKNPDTLNPFKIAIKLQSLINSFANSEVRGDIYTEPVDLVTDVSGKTKYQVRAALSRQIGQAVYLIDTKENTTALWFSIEASGPTIIDGRGDSVEDEGDWIQIADVLDGMSEQFNKKAMERADSLDIAGLVEDILDQRIDDVSQNLKTLKSKALNLKEGGLNVNNFRVKITGTTTADCIDEVIPTQSLSSAISIAVRIFKSIEKHSGSTASCSVDVDLGDGVLVPVPDESIRGAFISSLR